MSGGEKSAHAESFAFGAKRCRGALLAGTALVAAPAFLALSLGPAQAGDLINDSGTYVVHGKLAAEDDTNENERRSMIDERGKAGADAINTSGAIVNKDKLTVDDTLKNKSDGLIINKGRLRTDDLINSGKI